jgi:acetoin utilization protein AcuB
MTFVVYDYGIRTQTPWYDIFPPRDVDRLNELAASNKLSEQDQAKESQQPILQAHRDAIVKGKEGGEDSGEDAGEKKRRQLDQYRKVEDDSGSRSKLYYVKDLMTSPAISLHEQASMRQAWQIFQRHGFRHIPVLNSRQRVCGVISERDLLRASSSLEQSLPTSADAVITRIMTRKVLTVGPMTEVRELAAAMTGYRIGAMPVLDSDENLIGIVTRADVLRVIMNHAPIDLWG